MLRKILRLQPAAGEVVDSEGWDNYYSRTRAIIDEARQKSGQPCLIHRILREYFSDDVDELEVEVDAEETTESTQEATYKIKKMLDPKLPSVEDREWHLLTHPISKLVRALCKRPR